jgi:MoaA/NifB/PqqE/SkfB family radical SAM enzyme
MSENELLIESEELFGRLVEINWYFMAIKKITTIAKRKKFLAILEKQITQEANGSNVIFIEENGDVYICMIFRAKNLVKKVAIDVLDQNRRKPIQPNLQAGNVYIYGASGTIFQPNVKNGHPDIIDTEKYSDFDA